MLPRCSKFIGRPKSFEKAPLMNDSKSEKDCHRVYPYWGCRGKAAMRRRWRMQRAAFEDFTETLPVADEVR